MMKPVLAPLLALGIVLGFAAIPTRAATAEPTSSAWQWLALIDQEQYVESWAEGSALFRARITERSWESKTSLYREAVGRAVWRDVDSVSLAGRLPDLPEGQYALVRYRSKFERKTDCTETVGLVLENGLWRVASYSIK